MRREEEEEEGKKEYVEGEGGEEKMICYIIIRSRWIMANRNF